MTTPQYKFFDTVNKIFPENQEDYFIDNSRKCWEYVKTAYWNNEDDEYEFQLEKRENIIVVPFTGYGEFFEHDMINFCDKDGTFYKGIIQKYKRGTWMVKFISAIKYKPVMLERVWFHSEIIGSSLMNPELLNEK